MKEIWRNVVGYEGLYQVSDQGRVRSQPRINRSPKRGTRFLPGGLLKPVRMGGKSEYLIVSLSKNGKATNHSIHRLVLEAFVGPCPPGMECRHFPDRNGGNNNLCNLSWATEAQNQQDRVIHGTHMRGERNNLAKLTAGQVRAIRRLHATGKYTLCQLGDKYGVGFGAIHYIVKRVTWKHIE